VCVFACVCVCVCVYIGIRKHVYIIIYTYIRKFLGGIGDILYNAYRYCNNTYRYCLLQQYIGSVAAIYIVCCSQNKNMSPIPPFYWRYTHIHKHMVYIYTPMNTLNIYTHIETL